MDWWQILLIIVGAIVAGVIAGVLINYLISLIRKSPLFNKSEAGPSAASPTEPAPAAEPRESFFKRLSNWFPKKDAGQSSEDPGVVTSTAPAPQVTERPVPVAKVEPAPVSPPATTPAEPAVPAVQTAGIANELLTEVELNRKLATKPPTEKLQPFETKIWDQSRNGLQSLPTNLREDLTQAYVDIRLANSIVWLSAELGRRSPNLDESYGKLCNNIATRLARVILQLK